MKRLIKVVSGGVLLALGLSACVRQPDSLTVHAREALAPVAADGSLLPLRTASTPVAAVDEQPATRAVEDLLAAVRNGDAEAVRSAITKDRRLAVACAPSLGTAGGETPLGVAVEAGNLDMVKLLIESGADVNAGYHARRDPADKPLPGQGKTPLMLAAGSGQIAIVRVLLEHGADVRAREYSGRNALFYATLSVDEAIVALMLTKRVTREDFVSDTESVLNSACLNGSQAIVEAALARDVDLEKVDADGYTPLLSAAEKGNLEIVNALLKHGANHMVRTRKGDSALHLATSSGNLELVKVFLSLGHDVNAGGKETGLVPLVNAALYGRLAVVQHLLDHGARVEVDPTKTPLMLAACGARQLRRQDDATRQVFPRDPPGSEDDFLSVAALLIAKGAAVNAKTANGKTPLTMALNSGFEGMADLLVAKGADFKVEPVGGRTLLHDACSGGCKKYAELALSKGCSVDVRDNDGYTPLHTAADCGRPALIELLLDHGARLGAVTRDGRTALHLVAQGHIGVAGGQPLGADYAGAAEVLIHRGADVQAVMAGNGTQPLHWAALLGNAEAAHVLLDNKAPVDAADQFGNTPLIAAITYRKPAMVELLFAHGANLSLRTPDGLSMMELAQLKGTIEIVRLLRKHAAEAADPASRLQNVERMDLK